MRFFESLRIDFSAKVKWRMLCDRNPLFVTMQDKYSVREFARSRGVKTAELLFVTDRPETIPFDELPPRYLIKANHGCRWNILCYDSRFYQFKDGRDLVNQDGSFLNTHSAARYEISKAEVIGLCREWLSRDYSRNEWAYRQIRPKIVIEELLESKDEKSLKDYRLYTFHGVVKAINVGSPVFRNNGENVFFDADWNEIVLTKYSEARPDPLPEMPAGFGEMIQAAQNLCESIDFARVDLYDTSKGIILGEITIYPGGGRKLTPCPRFNTWLGDQWRIGTSDSIAAFILMVAFTLRSYAKCLIQVRT